MTTVKKISKLKNFGIFDDFTWKGLPEFKKYNLIYGWNRCGKTTISRVFVSCEKKSTYNIEKFKQYPEFGEFELSIEKGKTIKSLNVNVNDLNVKVFNQDFIDENISFEPSKYTNGIVYVSEKDISLKKKFDLLKIENNRLKEKNIADKKDLNAKEKNLTTFLQGVGREVSNVLFDKTYNKTKIENRLKEKGIESILKQKLTNSDKKTFENISTRKAGENISTIAKVIIKPTLFKDINEMYNYFLLLLKKKVISETLERLKGDEDLNNWVKTGYELHKEKGEYGNCLFCQNPLNSKVFDSLSKHFSKDYTELQNDIEVHLDEVSRLKFKEISIENNKLYQEFSELYRQEAQKLNTIIQRYNDWITHDVESLLREKYNNPFNEDLVEMFSKPEDYEYQLNNQIDVLNSIIEKHNNKVIRHIEEVKEAKEKLELHILATAFSDGIYNTIIKELEEAKNIEIQSLIDLNDNQAKIDEFERETSDISDAIEKINVHLRSYFGREEIILDLDDSKKGYLIYRDGKLANNLSEGEKTAIAFSYFIVKAEERNFKLKNGIVFIDDPISSLDSNFIYHSFALIKEHFNDVGQLFVSTHNFHFFNLLKEWFSQKNSKTKEDNNKLQEEGKQLKPIPCEFFMIESSFENKKRKSDIKALDKTLKKFKSEYHFLFNRINSFLNINPEYADLYSIGNITRRYFEIFADFKIPNSSNQKQKMEMIVKDANNKGAKISAAEFNKVYKLINEFSHNYEPLSAIEHTDKSEIFDSIKILLKIVEFSDENHYDVLKKNCLN